MTSIPLQTTDYASLPQRDGDDEGDDATLPQQHAAYGSPRLSFLRSNTLFPWILHTLLIAINVFTFIYLTHSRSSEDQRMRRFSSWSPAIEGHAVQYRNVPINASMGQQNQFKGVPSPELDAAWSNISSAVPRLKLSVGDLTKSHKDPSTASSIGPDDNSGYYGQLEIYELLACLNTLRKSAYQESYPEMQKGREGFDEEAWSASIDQCVDILRVELLCTSDVTPLIYLQRGGGPDFTMVKKCRDFDRILEWSRSSG